MFDFSICSCGSPLITETIKLKDGDNPLKPIATAVRCGRCPRIIEIRTLGVAGITLSMIEKVYRATRLGSYTLKELQDGKVHGYAEKPPT